MAKKKSKKASPPPPKKAPPKTSKKAPRAKSAPRKKAPAKKSPPRRKLAGPGGIAYGGNSVTLTYNANSSTFVAITTVDTSVANINWTAMGVELFDPNNLSFGAMNPDPNNSARWTMLVQNPTAGEWTAQANFQGNDNESGTCVV